MWPSRTWGNGELASQNLRKWRVGLPELEDWKVGLPELEDWRCGLLEHEDWRVGIPELDYCIGGLPELEDWRVGIPELDYCRGGLPELEDWRIGLPELEDWRVGLPELEDWRVSLPELEDWRVGLPELLDWRVGLPELLDWRGGLPEPDDWRVGLPELLDWKGGLPELEDWRVGLPELEDWTVGLPEFVWRRILPQHIVLDLGGGYLGQKFREGRPLQRICATFPTKRKCVFFCNITGLCYSWFRAYCILKKKYGQQWVNEVNLFFTKSTIIVKMYAFPWLSPFLVFIVLENGIKCYRLYFMGTVIYTSQSLVSTIVHYAKKYFSFLAWLGRSLQYLLTCW